MIFWISQVDGGPRTTNTGDPIQFRIHTEVQTRSTTWSHITNSYLRANRLDGVMAKAAQVAQIQLEQGKGRSLLTCHAPLSAPWVASWRRWSARCWNQDGGPCGAARAPPGRGRRGGRGSGLQSHRQPLGAPASPRPPSDHRSTHIALWKPQSYPAQRSIFKESCQHIIWDRARISPKYK